jgi:hypothetical protein
MMIASKLMIVIWYFTATSPLEFRPVRFRPGVSDSMSAVSFLWVIGEFFGRDRGVKRRDHSVIIRFLSR